MRTIMMAKLFSLLPGAALFMAAPAVLLWGQTLMNPLQAQRPDVDAVNPAGANFSLFSVSNGHSSLGATTYNDRIDNSIDEKSYYVGGGDVFMVSIQDMGARVYTGTVNQNGDLYIPSIGIVPLGRIPLARAKERIAGFVAAKLKKSEGVYISLQRVKFVTVCVSGSVSSPGTYELPGTMRLWDAIKAASKEEAREKKKMPDFNEYDFRSVHCRNRDSTATFDLLRFLYTGDLSQNPYIYPGDQITLFPTTRTCYIDGEVRGTLKGMVPIRENEPARDFLSLFVLGEHADSEHILIQQEKDGGGFETTTFSMQTGPSVTLRSGDVISVPSRKNTTEIMVAVVTGDVAHPGVFPIARGSTTAQSVIDLAGGYLPFANTDKAVIIRRNKLPTNHATDIAAKPEIGRPISFVRPELASALSMMSSTEDFSVIRIKDYPATTLEPWDQVMVPRSENVVYVSGNVKRPGGYPYKEGKDKAHYLRLAGGLTKKANSSNVYIVALFGDIMQTCDHKIVEDGDIIVVPASQEYKRLSTLVLPILNAAIGTLALIVAVMSQ